MKFNIKYITFSALLCASMVSCDLDVVFHLLIYLPRLSGKTRKMLGMD